METNSKKGAVAGILLLLTWTILATLFYHFYEGMTVINAIYMTIITISTVGYGEISQLSATGRIFTSFIIVAGIGTSVYTFTRIGQLVFEGELADIVYRRKMKKKLSNLEGHYIICGLGRVARTVLELLSDKNMAYCIIERDENIAEYCNMNDIPYLVGSATDDEVLHDAGIGKATTILAILPSDADNLYLTLAAKELNPNIRVIARASDEHAVSRLNRGGADHIVSPYSIAGQNITNALLYPALTELVESIAHPNMNIKMAEVVVKSGSKISGKSIQEANIRSHCNVMIVGLKYQDEKIVFNPKSSHFLVKESVIVVLGDEVEIEKLKALTE